MEKTTLKGSAFIAPVPTTMVSCGDMETANIITIGWTGIINTRPPMTYISVRPERHSYSIIKERGEFVINLVPQDYTKKADWCGVKSGKDCDKFEQMNLTKMRCSQIETPMIEQCPINLECVVKSSMLLGSHEMFIADIVAVNVNSNMFDEDGKIDMEKARLVAYSHGYYHQLGDKLGSFGYSVRKKKKAKQ